MFHTRDRWKLLLSLAMIPFLALAFAQVSLDVAFGSSSTFCGLECAQGCANAYQYCHENYGCLAECESQFENCAGQCGCDPGEGYCV